MKNIGIEFLMHPLYFVYRYPDKFMHMMLYMGFGFTLNPAVRLTLGRYQKLTSLAIGTAYGALDEFHQSFVPHRTMSASDLFADFVGLLVSQVIILVLMHLKQR